MSAQNNGGPAFPQTGTQWVPDMEAREVVCLANGMTLRDYFAAKAMQALIAHGYDSSEVKTDATAAYEIAGAMLNERAK